MRTVSLALVAMALVAAPACDDGGTEVQDDPIVTEKPASIPAFTDVDLYSAASPFNQAIPDNPTIDPNSAAYVGLLANSGAFVVQIGQYSAPVYFADENTPRVDVFLPCGDWWEMGVNTLTGVPIPTHAEPSSDTDGGAAPTACGEESDQDNHMVVLDLVNRCEIGFWQARRDGDAWVASWANGNSMDSDGVFDAGLSTRGSGFPFLGGVIWPDEMVNGAITHRLAFSYPFTASGGPVAPATDSDGVTDDAAALPMGAVLQLDPSLDLSTLGLSSYELAIATALQEYGMILVDTGGGSGIGVYGIDPVSVAGGDPYGDAFPDEDFIALPNIPLDSFRVLELPPQDGNWTDNLDLVNSTCAQFQ